MANIQRNCKLCGCLFNVPSAKLSIEHCIVEELNTTAFLCVDCAKKLIKWLQDNSIDPHPKSEADSNIEKTEQSSELPYATVNIGGKTWMAENLNLTDDRLGKDHWKDEKTGEVYYSWEAAMRIANKVEGFHLPSPEEWNQLAEDCRGVCYKPDEKNPGWKEYNNIGGLKKKIRIKLAGWYSSSTKNSFYIGSCADFWTSDKSGDYAYHKYFSIGGDRMNSDVDDVKRGLSVRLVADS